MRTSWLVVPALAAGLMMVEGRADACGGCFAPPETVTELDSHRMVVALSPNQTSLWDQIQYRGQPSEFVWVLPVPTEEARVALSSASFFDQLDRQTSARVRPANPAPNFSCPFPRSARFGGAADAAASVDGGVQVFREEVVGPYETVLIGSEDATALQTWLVDHGYQVPPETIPTIRYYVDKKSKFMALRLRPGTNVQAMQPVRVTFPGYMATFPLKMVTAGADGALSLTLWVIAEQRFQATNYPTLTVRAEDLTWDWASFSSDYQAQFTAAVERGGGRGWVAEFAQPWNNLFFQDFGPFAFGGADAGTTPYVDARDEAYFAGSKQRVPYLTRLRTRALVDHLAEDIELGPAADSSSLPPVLVVAREINRPSAPVCPNDTNRNGIDDSEEYGLPGADGQPCGVALGGSATGGPVLLLTLAVAILLLRQRMRRRR